MCVSLGCCLCCYDHLNVIAVSLLGLLLSLAMALLTSYRKIKATDSKCTSLAQYSTTMVLEIGSSVTCCRFINKWLILSNYSKFWMFGLFCFIIRNRSHFRTHCCSNIQWKIAVTWPFNCAYVYWPDYTFNYPSENDYKLIRIMIWKAWPAHCWKQLGLDFLMLRVCVGVWCAPALFFHSVEINKPLIPVGS